MSKVVIGVFDENDAAERAIHELKAQGFDEEISLVAR